MTSSYSIPKFIIHILIMQTIDSGPALQKVLQSKEYIKKSLT
jgi:hypothetical protein